MAIGIIGTDVQAFAENFSLGEFERMAQNISAMQALQGAIRVRDQRLKGPYVHDNVIRRYATPVSRRDPASTSAATDIPVQATSDTRVKLKRAWGPFANTKDAWHEMLSGAGNDPLALAQSLGQQAAEDQMRDELNAGLRAARAALAAQSDNTLDITGASTTTLTADTLVDAASLFGDAFSARIVAWVGHAKPYYNLVKSQVSTLRLDQYSAERFMSGEVGPVLGKPFYATDSDALTAVVSGTTVYYTLALVENAITIDNARPLDVAIDQITGLQNLVVRLQAEYDFNLGVKGFTWDVTNGGANPTDAAVATSTNWDKTGTTKKDLAGIVIIST